MSVELRPPRSGLDPRTSMDVWIDMHHGIRRLAGQDTLVFLTDDAVGDTEEESLAHISANVEAGRGLETVVPFLTCKHSVEYCRLFARRAAALGVAGITVVGGDRAVGPPRSVPHGSDLRKILREEVPDLPLGGWANPHASPFDQAGFVAGDDFLADYVLTQVVSHHSTDRVVGLQEALQARGVELPVVYGVFYYRSGNPRTLDVLNQFFPVPEDELKAEFEAGLSAEEICGRSVRALREVGVDNLYVSNLPPRSAATKLEKILKAADA
ncbi:MAG: hypothetical protein ACR2QM_18025 [Longimicrobiales bacterium]